MRSQTTPKVIFESLVGHLQWQWVAGKSGGQRQLQYDSASVYHFTVGLLSPIRRYPITLFGEDELDYLRDLPGAEQQTLLKRQLVDTQLVISCDDAIAPSSLENFCRSLSIPLIHSQAPAQTCLRELQYVLDNELAAPLIMHGVFMDVLGVGTLLQGGSGIGKSELALELLNHGHRLIADDAPEFRRTEPSTVTGKSPKMLTNWMEVRGLGILNIRELFGDGAIKRRQNLRLIVQLTAQHRLNPEHIDRLRGSRKTRMVLGVPIPEVVIPVAPGRNLAILVETAIRDQILRRSGYDASEQFAQWQSGLIEKQQQPK